MSDAWLIYNFGTQEPRIITRDGKLTPLKDRGRPLKGELGKADGLWTSAQIVFGEVPGRHPLTFPILKGFVFAAPDNAGPPRSLSKTQELFRLRQA